MLIPIVPTLAKSYSPAFALNLDISAGTGSPEYTFVQKVLAAGISQTGNSVRVRMIASTFGPSTIAACYIGLSATTGNAWNFASSPTQITWDNGQTSKTLAAGSEAVSDAASFAVPGGQAISIAFNLSTGFFLRYTNSAGSNFIRYVKPSVSEASSTTKGASYIANSGRVDYISQLLVAP